MENICSPKMMGLGFGRFFRYMLAYSYIFPQSKVANYWNFLNRSLIDTIIKKPIFKVEIPRNYDYNVFDEVMRLFGD
jgi:hypothetical protein